MDDHPVVICAFPPLAKAPTAALGKAAEMVCTPLANAVTVGTTLEAKLKLAATGWLMLIVFPIVAVQGMSAVTKK